MRLPHVRSLTFLVVLLSLVVVYQITVTAAYGNPQSSSEQDTAMDLLVGQVLEELKIAHIETVGVAHFSEEKKLGHRALSTQLTDSFTSILASIAGDIRVLDRARILQTAQQQKWMLIDIDNAPVFRSIAFSSGADAIIEAKFTREEKFVNLSLKITGTLSNKKIAEVKTKIPMPPAKGDSPDAPEQDPVTGVYRSNVGGVTTPTCKYCLDPGYSPEFRRENFNNATNSFVITVLSDGRPADIHLLKLVGYGMDEKALESLKQWQFSPAHLPNGTPVASRVEIEFNYQLF